jgi:A/G-specific adenine glycosylase
LKKLIIKGMDKRYFSEKVVKWYLNHKRELPWRATSDAYKIWLSEIILQQTRVKQGLPYYEAFLQAFPTVNDLATASEQQVLRLWQGLGYYARARNLHKCAKTVVVLYNGNFPETYADLLSLPGVGEYTAAAIASFAYQEPVAVVDGNVFRVLSRIFGIDTIINSPKGKKEFTEIANELISKTAPDLHNQAMMEFGATQCTPKNPKCDECIFKSGCVAFARNTQGQLPVKTRSKDARKRYFYYLVVQRNNSLMMKKRTDKDIWNGLFDFHLIEKNREVNVEKLLKEKPLNKLSRTKNKITISKTYKHVLSHQIIHSRFISIKTEGKMDFEKNGLAYYSLKKIAKLSKPVLVSRFLEDNDLL